MSNSRLPKTDSIQELASFWDSHDLTDFETELEEVDERVFSPSTDITIRLEKDAVGAIRAAAAARGVRDSELLRQWVLERLHAM